MSLKKLLILAIILAGGLSVVRYVELPREEAKRVAGLALQDTDSDKITSVTISQPDKAPYTLKRAAAQPSADAKPKKESSDASVVDVKTEPGSWELIRGGLVVDTKLDGAALEALISQVVSISLGEPLPAAELETDLAPYGLATPELVIKVERGDGAPVEFKFGKRSTFTGGRYLQMGDGRVFMLAEGLFQVGQKEMDSLRSRTRVEFENNDVQQIAIVAHGETVELRKGAEGKGWRIAGAPSDKEANQEKVVELLRRLRALQAVKFFDTQAELPSGVVLDKPQVRITLKDDKGVLIPGANDIKLYVQSDDPANMVLAVGDTAPFAKIQGNSINSFALSADTLLEKRFFRVDKSQIAEVAIVRRGTSEPKLDGSLFLKRDGDSWKVDDAPGDRAFVEDYLRRLGELEFSSVVTEPVDFPSEPAVSVLVKSNNKSDIKIEAHPYRTKDEANSKNLRPLLRVTEALNTTPVGDAGAAQSGVKLFRVSDELVRKLSPRKEALLPVTEDAAKDKAPKVDHQHG